MSATAAVPSPPAAGFGEDDATAVVGGEAVDGVEKAGGSETCGEALSSAGGSDSAAVDVACGNETLSSHED